MYPDHIVLPMKQELTNNGFTELKNDDNIKDFQLKKVGEVFSMFNLQKGEVIKKQNDLDLAFSMGVRLGTALSRS